MNNLELRNDTAMTGIILPDGLIGPVGEYSKKSPRRLRWVLKMY